MGNGTEICQISLECKAAFEAGLAIGAPPLGVRPWFKTAQGTFNLWAASIKATSTSKASLDYRLRNHVKVRQAICSLIKALIQSLAKCQELVAGGPSDDSANSVSDSGSDSAPSWDAISNASGVNENLASLVEPANPLLDEHVLYIKTNINQLLRISSEIRKSGNKYRFGKIDGELEENSFSDFRQHLTAVILRGFHDDKAPDLPAYENIRRAFIFDRLNKVQQRLVRANILRRNRIQVLSKTRYRPKLSTQNQPNPVLKRDAALGLVINDTEADPEPIPRPTSSDPDAQPQAGLSRTATSTAGQRTVTATEPGSHVETRVESLIKRTRTPSNITGVTRIGSTQAFPRCPAPGMDGAVMCPYCGDPLELESDDGQVSGKGPKRNGRVEHKWKYHVAQDIIPYSCISEECDTPDEMHLTAQSLVAHTIENHGVERWACDYCLSQSTATGLGRTSDHQAVFETAEDWAAHINTLHPNKIPQTKLPTFMKINKRVMLEPMGCPLCEYVCESEFATSTIDDHILQHLYEFALRALPDGNNDDESNDELSKLSQQSGSLSHTKLVQDSGPTDLSAEIARYEEKLNVMRRVDAESFVFDNVLEKHGSLKEQPLMNNLQRSIFLGSNSDESQMLKEGLKTEMFKLMMAWDSSREYLDGQLELSDGSAVSVEEIPVIYLLENLTAETVTSRGIFDFSKLSVSEISTCLSVPRHQNFPGEPPVFVGRGAILNQLEELVVDFEVAISSVTMATLSKSAQQLRVVLSGPSQAGKTAVAQQFAYNRRQDTDNKLEFWIDATSAESIGEGYADGLRLLGLLPSVLPSTLPNEDMMRMFLILLNTKLNTSFTMVFDGIGVATLHYLCFKNLLPQAFHGILLFTTTDTDCLALLGYHKNIHVGHCSEVELAKTKGRSTLFFGIDFGTTFSGVSWAWSGNPEETYMVTKWPTRLHRDSGREKIPTELEITTATTGEEQISFGYDIPASSDPFRWFKLLLVEDQLPQRLELSDELAKAREKMEKANLDAVRVVAKYLRELWRHTTQEVKNILSENSVAECRFHIVVTVPALWKDAARQSMREAVEAAGLLVARRAGPTTLDLLSEPAAAAIATFASMQGRPDIVSGDSMLIVAAGSVTVELICYNVDSVDPFRLSECIEGSSGYCGAVFLDQNFQNHLRNRLTPQVWDAISAKDLKKFLNNEWEHGIKQAFDGLDEKSYTIDLPSSCEVEDDELTLEHGELEEIFDDIVEEINILVRQQIEGVTARVGIPPKYVILVGGFGRCRYLRTSILKLVDPAKTSVLQGTGSTPWTAVCRGAVLHGLNHLNTRVAVGSRA